MKRLFSVLITVLLILSCYGCRRKEAEETGTVSSSSNICMTCVEVSSLIPGPSAVSSSVVEEHLERIVLSGKIGTYSHKEVLKIQKEKDPNNAGGTPYDWEFRLIVLDEPAVITAMSGDGLMEKEVRFIVAGGRTNNGYEFFEWADIPDDLDGKEITFSIDPYVTYFTQENEIPFHSAYTVDFEILS